MSTTLILIIIGAVLVIMVIATYNRLVKLRNNRENAFADIDVQLKQRYDLIPSACRCGEGVI
jgi:LemA protein